MTFEMWARRSRTLQARLHFLPASGAQGFAALVAVQLSSLHAMPALCCICKHQQHLLALRHNKNCMQVALCT
jgi:hypothetical protein